jgi:hypothetical protein
MDLVEEYLRVRLHLEQESVLVLVLASEQVSEQVSEQESVLVLEQESVQA